jgi:hypothetical protein
MQSKQENYDESREVYLPLGNFWYQSNLMPWDDQGSALLSPVEGGTVINYTARITSEYKDFPYIVPTFIREGRQRRGQIFLHPPFANSSAHIFRCSTSSASGSTECRRHRRPTQPHQVQHLSRKKSGEHYSLNTLLTIVPANNFSFLHKAIQSLSRRWRESQQRSGRAAATHAAKGGARK